MKSFRSIKSLGRFAKSDDAGTGKMKRKKIARNVSEAARTLGHFGGVIGGPARARKLSADRRKEIAQEGGRAANKSLDQPHLCFEEPHDNNVDWLLWEQIEAIMPKKCPAHLPHMVGVIDGVNVFLVDGNEVMKRDMDFVAAANDLELLEQHGDSYIPPRTVFVDATTVDPSQWCFNCYHELAERRLLEHGVTYVQAHDRVNREEHYLRHKFGVKSQDGQSGRIKWRHGKSGEWDESKHPRGQH